ncbi:type IV secretory system conjugative DNA transfer family protein [Vibrio vulnificus]|uniref:type IV secretory system conjugative DNA transfer family protein n=1 Tax=Vibrio vulnificus TaxID=672 RepID=UPI004059CE49
MAKKLNTPLVVVGIVCLFVVFGVAGVFLGGAVFLKITSISMDTLSYDTLFYYWKNYGDERQVVKWLQLGSFTAAAISTLPPIFILYSIFAPPREEIHGSARFANDKELAESGLFNKEIKEPVLLLGKMDKGQFAGQFVKAEGKSFVGVSAGTGQGKGIGFVLPNAVNYSDSVIFLDIKLENFIKSAGYRQSCGQEVYLFSPDGYAVTKHDAEAGILRSHRWNAFSYIRRQKAFRNGDVQMIAMSLYPLSGDAKADMWQGLAGNFFSGLVYWMLDTEKFTGMEPTFPYLISLFAVDGGLNQWIKNELEKDYLSPECIKEFSSFDDYPNETKGSIRATVEAPLSIFMDKTVAAAVSGNDFDFRKLRRKGISIYVGVQPPNKSRFQRLLNLFFEQLIAENTRVIPENDDTLTHQLLLMLDEFPTLGRVNQIKESIGYTRQYNVRYALIYQDKSQLEDKALYDKEGAENITSNLMAEIIYPPSKVTNRVKEISTSLGTKTVRVKNDSVSRGDKTSRSDSYTQQSRELLKPHEIVELGYEKHPTADVSIKALMFKQNQRSFIMNKIISFDDKAIAPRIKYAKENIPEIPLLNIQ